LVGGATGVPSGEPAACKPTQKKECENLLEGQNGSTDVDVCGGAGEWGSGGEPLGGVGDLGEGVPAAQLDYPRPRPLVHPHLQLVGGTPRRRGGAGGESGGNGDQAETPVGIFASIGVLEDGKELTLRLSVVCEHFCINVNIPPTGQVPRSHGPRAGRFQGRKPFPKPHSQWHTLQPQAHPTPIPGALRAVWSPLPLPVGVVAPGGRGLRGAWVPERTAPW